MTIPSVSEQRHGNLQFLLSQDVGHTIQIDADKEKKDLRVYYKHYGDFERGYAGIPSGWYSKSYAWLPYALYFHHMYKYVEYVDGIDLAAYTKTFYGINSRAYDGEIYPHPPDGWIVPEDETEFINAHEKVPMLRKVVG